MDGHRDCLIPACCFALLLPLPGCSSRGADSREEYTSHSSALTTSLSGTTRVKVRVGVDNVVTAQALPSALCLLHSADTTDSTQALEVPSDAHGLVYFHVDPDSAGSPETILLDCTDESGSLATYSVEMDAAVDTPALVAPPPQGPVRPVLTGDPLAPSQAQLTASGYPPRPDPVKDPARYQRWLNDVSRPAIMGAGTRIRTNSRFQLNGWAGYSVPRQPRHGPFPMAEVGDLQAPYQWGTPPAGVNIVAFWVGVGGGSESNPPSSMFQGGLVMAWYPSPYNVLDYEVWDELVVGCGCCLARYYGGCSPISGGDILTVQEWLGGMDSNNNCTAPYNITGKDNKQCLWTYITISYQRGGVCQYGPLGTSVSATILAHSGPPNYYTPAKCPANLNGDSAEWITERYTATPVAPGYPTLRFASAMMYGAYAQDNYTGRLLGVGASGVTQDLWTMSNDCPTAPTPVTFSLQGQDTVSFVWKNYGTSCH